MLKSNKSLFLARQSSDVFSHENVFNMEEILFEARRGAIYLDK